MRLHAGALGRWLGIFAIAMLFIGPPIGQWRAAQQASAFHAWDAFCCDLSKLAASAGNSHGHSHAGGHAHDQGQASVALTQPGGKADALTQVGVLTLDHCGYCHLVACFAALPGTWANLPRLDWNGAPAAPFPYHAPSALFISTKQARAPPLFHS